MIEWIRFSFAAFFLFGGLIVAGIATIGLYKFKFVLNRMHAAAMCDTLSILFVLFALILSHGFEFISLKLLFIIVFLWFASPVSSHLISRLEFTTDDKAKEEYEVKHSWKH